MYRHPYPGYFGPQQFPGVGTNVHSPLMLDGGSQVLQHQMMAAMWGNTANFNEPVYNSPFPRTFSYPQLSGAGFGPYVNQPTHGVPGAYAAPQAVPMTFSQANTRSAMQPTAILPRKFSDSACIGLPAYTASLKRQAQPEESDVKRSMLVRQSVSDDERDSEKDDQETFPDSELEEGGEDYLLASSQGQTPRVKGPWTIKEDALLKQLVKQYGKRWSLVAEKLPGRIGKQCRERWLNHLDPKIVRSPWTPDEDRILLETQKSIGNKWCEIAKLLPGRPENSVKNRFTSLSQKGATI